MRQISGSRTNHYLLDYNRRILTRMNKIETDKRHINLYIKESNLLFTLFNALSLLMTIGKLTLQAATNRINLKTRMVKTTGQYPQFDPQQVYAPLKFSTQAMQSGDSNRSQESFLTAQMKVVANDGAASD